MSEVLWAAVIGAIGVVAAALIQAWASKRRPGTGTPSKVPNPPGHQNPRPVGNVPAPSQPARIQSDGGPDTGETALTHARTQYEIIDAILGAYPYSNTGRGLSARRQQEMLGLAHKAKLPDGKSAFPVMSRWDGGVRTNRMGSHVSSGKAIKHPQTNQYMLAEGVAPAELGVRQAVVNALAEYSIIPWYDVHKATHVAPDE